MTGKRSVRPTMVAAALALALAATACVFEPPYAGPGPDTTAPVLDLPDDLVVAATGPTGAAVTWSATAEDAVDGPVPVECVPASGEEFTVGDTEVTCTASDAAANVAEGGFTVTVTPFIPNAIQISAGDGHTCAVLADGTARCWGSNNFGQLGNGTTGGSSNVPVAVSGITNATEIRAGSGHTCAVLADGTARCWGFNSQGQLGRGNTTNSNVPVAVSGITNATQITAGYLHSCAVLTDGTARCWGWNGNGQLGRGNTTNSNVPVAVSGITNATQITAGYLHSCVVLTDGEARCWGFNGSGQLGRGNTTNSNAPVAVSDITNATQIIADTTHTCAVLTDGEARCWGNNDNGKLGTGDTTNSNAPVAVSDITNATQISADTNHTCAVLADGTARCWGDNAGGKLGNGTTGGGSYLPVQVVDLP